MKIALVLLAITTLAAAVAPDARATPTLRGASIAEGELVDISPFTFTVVYSERVTVTDMWLIDQFGTVTRVPSPQLTSGRLTTALPVLVPHRYRLHWTVRDTRNELVQGSVGFSIRGCEQEGGGTP